MRGMNFLAFYIRAALRSRGTPLWALFAYLEMYRLVPKRGVLVILRNPWDSQRDLDYEKRVKIVPASPARFFGVLGAEPLGEGVASYCASAVRARGRLPPSTI